MPRFTNSPEVKDQNNEGMVKRYVHQEMTLEHYGIHAKIQSNGKVIITGKPVKVDGGVEFDEVEIPASLVFKIALMLKNTRSVKYVSVVDAPVDDSEA